MRVKHTNTVRRRIGFAALGAGPPHRSGTIEKDALTGSHLFFRAPCSARIPSTTRIWPREASETIRSWVPLTPPRRRHASMRPLPADASASLRPVAAKRPVLFRPRGFSPPRRFPPHGDCALEVRCQPGFAGQRPTRPGRDFHWACPRRRARSTESETPPVNVASTPALLTRHPSPKAR